YDMTSVYCAGFRALAWIRFLDQAIRVIQASPILEQNPSKAYYGALFSPLLWPSLILISIKPAMLS
ncbi:hypothetical protein KI387_035858, partial [Taxus chinensis]